MTVQRGTSAFIAGITIAVALCVAAPVSFSGVSAAEQATVSTADIQRLQDEVYQASTDVSRLRTTDALQAGRLQDELDTLREDVIYLKVKLRKENVVSRAEYTQLRDQLTDLRTRARGEARAPAPRASTGHGAAPRRSNRCPSTTTVRGRAPRARHREGFPSARRSTCGFRPS